jgi:endoglucanase
LAVDVNHAVDYPGVAKSRFGQLDVGFGPSVMRGANANPETFRIICEAGNEDGIPYQVDVAPGGTGTDGNAMQLNRSGMAVGILGVALRYMHTPCELLSLTDVENCARLMAAYCRRITPATDFTPRIR